MMHFTPQNNTDYEVISRYFAAFLHIKWWQHSPKNT